jgi:chain length determinant protein tyrosine kinase EpsG
MNAAVEQSARLEPRLVERRSRPRGTHPLAALSPALVAAHSPASGPAESLRELRSQLLLRWFNEHRTLAVIGAHEEDGADVVAANIAIAMAQLGESTLLIDANLRDPRQHQLFGLRPIVGLSALLMNRDVHVEAVQQVPAVEHLHVLCAGSLPPNPQELVSRTPLIYLLKTLPDRFRAVIVATPPALAYADAQVIAARARGCVLVTRRHRTRVADVARVKAQLEPARAVLLGAVIRE